MDYKSLIEQLREQGVHSIYGAKFADACIEAAEVIEKMFAEREEPLIHAHVITNWLGDSRCSACGNSIDSTSNYCNWCGAKLDGAEWTEY